MKTLNSLVLGGLVAFASMTASPIASGAPTGPFRPVTPIVRPNFPVLPPLPIDPRSNIDVQTDNAVEAMQDFDQRAREVFESIQEDAESAMAEVAASGGSYGDIRKVAVQYEKLLKKSSKAMQKELKKFYKTTSKSIQKSGGTAGHMTQLESAFNASRGDIDARAFDALDDVFAELENIAEEL